MRLEVFGQTLENQRNDRASCFFLWFQSCDLVSVLCIKQLRYDTETVQVTPLRRTLASSP